MNIPFNKMHKQFIDNLVGNQTVFSNSGSVIHVTVTFTDFKKFDKTEEHKYTNIPDNVYKILVSARATSRIISFFDKQQNAEILFVSDMLVDRYEHITNPTFILLSQEEQDQVRKEFNMTDDNFPVIKYNVDPMARYFQLSYGEIVEINRPSETAGIRVSYSICK
jgi:DNA-directed RNA polymerase subunit H (RpoH/RPB5)